MKELLHRLVDMLPFKNPGYYHSTFHWLYQPYEDKPPAPFKVSDTDLRRLNVEKAIRKAARYTIKKCTNNGQAYFPVDPDYFVETLIVSLLGDGRNN